MKKNILISSIVLVIGYRSMAQKQDSVPGRSLAEKGAQGDILLGKGAKKNRLLDTPQRLQIPDSSQKKDIHSKRKNQGHKKV